MFLAALHIWLSLFSSLLVYRKLMGFKVIVVVLLMILQLKFWCTYSLDIFIVLIIGCTKLNSCLMLQKTSKFHYYYRWNFLMIRYLNQYDQCSNHSFKLAYVLGLGACLFHIETSFNKWLKLQNTIFCPKWLSKLESPVGLTLAFETVI